MRGKSRAQQEVRGWDDFNGSVLILFLFVKILGKAHKITEHVVEEKSCQVFPSLR